MIQDLSPAIRRNAARITEAPREWWHDYHRDPCVEHRNRLVEHYLPLVRMCVDQLRFKLPENTSASDLLAWGVFGLMEAIESYDLSRSVKFKTYAPLRIRGAIFDQIRKDDWVPRLVRSKARELEKARAELEGALGREPSDLEMADHMGLTLAELDDLIRGGTPTGLMSAETEVRQYDSGGAEDCGELKDLLADTTATDPADAVDRNTVMQAVCRRLTMKERLIVMLYYFEDLTMREIGDIIGISESRTCQLHTRLIRTLRKFLPEGISG